MELFRSSESCFAKIKGYPFASHYVDVEGIRIHYLDEGAKDSTPVLLLHGVPTWSFLYRKMIPVLVKAGNRVIAPDLVGFGKSDKPAEKNWHTLDAHVRVMQTLLEHLDLNNITLFGQDWGSMIGLRVAMELENRFHSIVISNGGLPTGKEKVPLAFIAWNLFARFSPWFPIDHIVNWGSLYKLSKEDRIAYKAPFENPKFKIGPRVLPRRVPHEGKNGSEQNMMAWEKLSTYNKPFLTLFSDNDPITRGFDKILRDNIPGSAGQDHKILHAGHFIQEDAGVELAEIISTFIDNNKG